MIKVFTLNRNEKIELTKKQLEQLLNESYWEGYNSKKNTYWTYTSPSITNPYPYTISSSDISNSSITIKTHLGD